MSAMIGMVLVFLFLLPVFFLWAVMGYEIYRMFMYIPPCPPAPKNDYPAKRWTGTGWETVE